MKTFKIYTLGCKVNQYESQLLREQFMAAGYRAINTGAGADVCVINTCTVTAKADSDSVYSIRKAIRENPSARIVATGCLAQLDSNRLKTIPGLDAVIKNRDKENLPVRLSGRKAHVQGISFFAGHARAFLKVQDGCDNFCSYCKVPLVRGRSRSRPIDDICAEAGVLAARGCKEIVLCGVCLGDYGKDFKDKTNLVNCIECLERIPGLARIRLSSIEINDVTSCLITCMQNSRTLCHHLHIPLQSGDNRVLADMNRRYTRSAFIDAVRKIKSRISDIAITTDVMVGFPTETEEAFCNTVRLVKKIAPLKVHIFPYSQRPGTAASSRYPDCLKPTIVKARCISLLKVARDCSVAYQKKFLGKKLDVLIEEKSKYEPGFWQGHTGNYMQVFLRSRRNLAQQIVSVRLTGLFKGGIQGRLV